MKFVASILASLLAVDVVGGTQVPDRHDSADPSKSFRQVYWSEHHNSGTRGRHLEGDGGLKTTDLEQVTPEDLVEKLIGNDASLQVSNVVYTGVPIASGIFTGGKDIIGFENGIILTTGATDNVKGPNINKGTTQDNDPTEGDVDLQAELAQQNMITMDASVLEFDFECNGLDMLNIEYVFASEEYPEFVGSPFNDVFAFFLNGENVAHIPGTDIPVAINTINCANETAPVCALYKDNEFGAFDTEMDGFTVPLNITAKTTTVPGMKNHIKIAVADVGDGLFDSAVFIKSGSFKCVAPTDAPSAGPTPEPTPVPTPAPTFRPTPQPVNKGANGDPHITAWTGFKFDYQGACDLILVKNPSFGNGLGMDINIRTKLQGTEGSYIESVAIKIGKDVLEVKADYTKRERQLWLNGVANFVGSMEGANIGGYPVIHKKESHKLLVRKRHVYIVEISKTEQIIIKQFKHLLNIHFNSTNKEEHFQGSLGLMGSFDSGLLVGRDGKTEYDDFDTFGEEWQVKSTEPMLFHEIDGPQHPEACAYVSRIDQQEKRRELHNRKEGAAPVKTIRRRLTQTITHQQAAEACSIVANADDRKNCIFDVISLNDLDMVGIYMDEDAETSVAH